jgi:hypothetical protein
MIQLSAYVSPIAGGKTRLVDWPREKGSKRRLIEGDRTTNAQARRVLFISYSSAAKGQVGRPSPTLT